MRTRQPCSQLLRIGILAVALILASTGCVKLDGDFTVNPDDTVDGTMILGVDKQLTSMLGEQLGPDALTHIPEGAKATEWSNAAYTGLKIVFDGVTLENFNRNPNGDTNQLTIKHKDGQYVLNGTLALSNLNSTSGGEFPGDLSAQAMSSAKLRMEFTFPGEIVETNGKVSADGRTVTFTPDAGGAIKMHVVAKEGSAFPWLLVGVGVGIAAVLAVGVVLIARRQQRGTSSEAQGVGAPQ